MEVKGKSQVVHWVAFWCYSVASNCWQTCATVPHQVEKVMTPTTTTTPGVKAYSGRHKCSQGDKRGQRQGHRGRRCPHQPSGGVTHKGQRVEATQCPRALEVVETEIHGGP